MSEQTGGGKRFTVEDVNALLPQLAPISYWHTIDGGFQGRRPL